MMQWIFLAIFIAISIFHKTYRKFASITHIRIKLQLITCWNFWRIPVKYVCKSRCDCFMKSKLDYFTNVLIFWDDRPVFKKIRFQKVKHTDKLQLSYLFFFSMELLWAQVFSNKKCLRILRLIEKKGVIFVTRHCHFIWSCTL